MPDIDPLLPTDDFFERGRKTVSNIGVHVQNGWSGLRSTPDLMSSTGPAGLALGAALTPTSTYEQRFALGPETRTGWQGGLRDALVRTAGIADRVGLGLPSAAARNYPQPAGGLRSAVTPALPGVSGTMFHPPQDTEYGVPPGGPVQNNFRGVRG